MRTCIKCKAAFEEEMKFCPECGAKYLMYDSMSYRAETCPIIIAEKSLAIVDDKTIVRIILGNIGETEVSAVSITLKCYDQFGDALQDTIVKFNDLMADTDECFGEDKIITPVDSDTRRFDVIINKIIFDDGSLWDNNGNTFTADSSYTYLRDSWNVKIVEQKYQAVWDALQEWHDEYYDYIVSQGKEIKKAEIHNIQDKSEIAVLREKFDSAITKRNDILKGSPEIVIPNEISEIPEWCFAGVIVISGDLLNSIDTYQESPVTSIRIPSSVEKITDYNFYRCRNLKTVIIDKGVKEIGNYAFADANGLSDISIPDSVESIGKYAFCNCESLKEIKIPESVKGIGGSVFKNSGIEKITFFGTSTKIDYYAFYSCYKLKEVILPSGLECIPSSAFRDCDSLVEVAIPSSLKSIAVFSADKEDYKKNHDLELQYHERFMKAADNDPKKWGEYFLAEKKYRELADKALKNREPDIVPATAENLIKYKVFPKDCKILYEKDIRIRQYWQEHSEEKQRLDSELNELTQKIESINSENNSYEAQIKKVHQKESTEVPAMKERKELNDRICSLESELANLSIFKSKEKRAIREQIDKLYKEREELNEKIRVQEEALSAECAEKVNELNGKIDANSDSIKSIERRISEIEKELTKER